MVHQSACISICNVSFLLTQLLLFLWSKHTGVKRRGGKIHFECNRNLETVISLAQSHRINMSSIALS